MNVSEQTTASRPETKGSLIFESKSQVDITNSNIYVSPKGLPKYSWARVQRAVEALSSNYELTQNWWVEFGGGGGQTFTHWVINRYFRLSFDFPLCGFPQLKKEVQ